MSAFRKFDPWAEIADEPDGPAKVAKPAKAPPRQHDTLDVNAAGRARPGAKFSHFSRFSRWEPANGGDAGPAAAARPTEEPPSREIDGTVAWGAAEWRVFIGERVATAAAASRVDRATAARWAYEACVTRWLNAHPPPADPTRCAYSGDALPADGGDAVPVLRGGGGHVWVRLRHLEPWRARRRAEAVAALAAAGVGAP